MFINERDFTKMIENACSIDEVSELREMLEGDEYEIESHLAMSSLLYEKEEIYGL